MFVWATWVYSANPGVLISCDSFKRNLINQTAKPRPEKDIITIRKVSQAAVCTLSQTGKPHWRKIKLQAALRGTCCRHRLTFCSLHGKCHEEEKEERRTSDRRSTKCKCDCAKMCFYLHWKCFDMLLSERLTKLKKPETWSRVCRWKEHQCRQKRTQVQKCHKGVKFLWLCASSAAAESSHWAGMQQWEVAPMTISTSKSEVTVLRWKRGRGERLKYPRERRTEQEIHGLIGVLAALMWMLW